MVVILLDNVVSTGVGSTKTPVVDAPKTFQATVSGTGAVSAIVAVEVSNDSVNFLTLGTITLSGTTVASDGFASFATWTYVRGNLTSISGTSAVVVLSMGI